MRNSNPIENTGVVVRKSDKEVLGSCFLFRYPETLLTATHCTTGLSKEDLAVALPGSRNARLFDISEVTRHPTADLAVLRVRGIDERDVTWTVNELFNDASLGLDFLAYGFPRNEFGHDTGVTPRLFKGYFQRFFAHSSHLGFKYLAAELSVPCPVGLSGSAVLNAHFIGRLYGVVTENIQVSTEVGSVLEVDDKGRKFREVQRDIIKYGLCVWLPALSDWLDSQVPRVSNDELSRRAKNQQAWMAEERARGGG
jgi:hypothetical protein